MKEANDVDHNRRLAARVAAGAEIKDVRLFSASLKLISFPSESAHLKYGVKMTPRVDCEPGANRFVVRTEYEVQITLADSAEAASTVADVTFELGGLFELDARAQEHAPSEEELAAFSSTTGQMALWPFAREFVFNATGRLGLPPLAIGVFRLPLSSDEINQKDLEGAATGDEIVASLKPSKPAR